MTLNLDTIPSVLREKHIRIGRGFPASNTLEQADETLRALGLFGSYLVAEGFTATDGERLAAARDLLIAAGVTRETVRGNRKSTRQAVATHLREAKGKRLRARTVLENTKSNLELRTDAAAVEAVRLIDGALLQTQSAGADPEPLATQLEVLHNTLGHAVVREEAEGRGGAQAIEDLRASAVAVRGAVRSNTKRRGTVAETERLDQIGGIIVDLTRRARKAARSAARQIGQPSIARAFELDLLYGATGGGKEEDDTEESEPPVIEAQPVAAVSLQVSPPAAPSRPPAPALSSASPKP